MNTSLMMYGYVIWMPETKINLSSGPINIRIIFINVTHLFNDKTLTCRRITLFDRLERIIYYIILYVR